MSSVKSGDLSSRDHAITTSTTTTTSTIACTAIDTAGTAVPVASPKNSIKNTAAARPRMAGAVQLLPPNIARAASAKASSHSSEAGTSDWDSASVPQTDDDDDNRRCHEAVEHHQPPLNVKKVQQQQQQQQRQQQQQQQQRQRQQQQQASKPTTPVQSKPQKTISSQPPTATVPRPVSPLKSILKAPGLKKNTRDPSAGKLSSPAKPMPTAPSSVAVPKEKKAPPPTVRPRSNRYCNEYMYMYIDIIYI